MFDGGAVINPEPGIHANQKVPIVVVPVLVIVMSYSYSPELNKVSVKVPLAEMVAAAKLADPAHKSPSSVRIVIVRVSVSSFMPQVYPAISKLSRFSIVKCSRLSVNSDNRRAVEPDNSH